MKNILIYGKNVTISSFYLTFVDLSSNNVLFAQFSLAILKIEDRKKFTLRKMDC